MECNKCGNQMDFIEIKGVDVCSKTGEIWIHEKWECLECGNLGDKEIFGKTTKVPICGRGLCLLCYVVSDTFLG